MIFANLRKFAVYLLSCNASEVLTVGIAALAEVPLPLLPLQILFLNLVTDVVPALALGFGQGAPGVMQRPPRSADEPVLTAGDWRAIAGHASLLTAAVLGALAAAMHAGFSGEQVVTVSFLTLASAQLWHVFDMRGAGAPLLRNEVSQNPWIWGALAICAALLLVASHVPVLSEVLQLAPIGSAGWLLVLVFGLSPVVANGALRAFAVPRAA